MIRKIFKTVLLFVLLALAIAPFAIGQWIKHDSHAFIEKGYTELVKGHSLSKQMAASLASSTLQVDKMHSGWLNTQVDAHVTFEGKSYPIGMVLHHGPVWFNNASGSDVVHYGIAELSVSKWPKMIQDLLTGQVKMLASVDISFHQNIRASIDLFVGDVASRADSEGVTLLEMHAVAKGAIDNDRHIQMAYFSLHMPYYSQDDFTVTDLAFEGVLKKLDSLHVTWVDPTHFHVGEINKVVANQSTTIKDITITPEVTESNALLSFAINIELGNVSLASPQSHFDFGRHAFNFVTPELPASFILTLIGENFDGLNILDKPSSEKVAYFNHFLQNALDVMSEKQLKFNYRNDAPHSNAQLKMVYTFPDLHYHSITPPRAHAMWCLLDNPDAYLNASAEVLWQQPCVSSLLPATPFFGELFNKIMATFKNKLELNVNVAYKNQCRASMSKPLDLFFCSWFGDLLSKVGLTSELFIDGGNDTQTLDMSWHQGKAFVNGELVSPEPEGYQSLSPVSPH